MNFKMSIKNYKSFKSKQEITFAPITIFVGPNSGGKSSILKLLGFLKQNILSESYSTNKNRVIYSGHFADLRNFNSMTHKHNGHPIEIELDVPRAGIEDESYGGPTGYEFFNEKTRLAYSITKDKAIPSYRFSNTDTFDLSEPNFFGEFYPQKEAMELIEGLYKITNSTKKKISESLTSIKSQFLSCLSLITEADKEASEKRWNEFNKSLQKFHFLKCDGFNFLPSVYNFDNNITPIFAYYEKNHQFFQLFELTRDYGCLTDRFTEADCFDDTNFEEYYSQLFKYLPACIGFKRKGNAEKIFLVESDLFENIKNYIQFHLKSDIKEKQLVVLENVLWHSLLEMYIDNYITEYNKIRDNYESHVKPTLHALMSSMVFLPPVRKKPREIYSEKEIIATLLGENSPILDEEVSSNIWIKSAIEGIIKDVDTVNHYLIRMGITQQIEIRKINDSSISAYYVLELMDKSTGHASTLNDVGYGFSQILPILFSIKNYYTGQTIVIEQPELHLHPALQSKFSEILADSITKGKRFTHRWGLINEEKIPLNFIDQNSVIIETHSEHIIRGIQVQIAQGKISKEDVAVNFVGKHKNGNSFVKRMHLTETGMFEEDWPGGLFEDSYQQSLELLKRQ